MQTTDYVNSCITPNLDNIAFWPPPDDADGRCSCPIAKVTTAQALSNNFDGLCSDNVDPLGQSAEEIAAYATACLCCGISGFLSSLASFCPRQDPTELGFDTLEQIFTEDLPGLEWAECDQWMSGYDCAADFGFPSDIKTYYGPGEIPKGGTETLHNIGALTSPVLATVTFAIDGDLVPITAVSTDAAVPTGSSDSGDSDESSDSESNSPSESSDTSDSADDGDSDSGNEETTSSEETPGDFATHQMSLNPLLLGCVGAFFSLVYIL
ncbi:hypothetical protein BJX70DRAFT_50227 [Aspergillus crustosus]